MKTRRIIGNVVLLLLGALFTAAGWLAYRISDHEFQTALMQRLTGYLSGKLGTKVQIGRTEIDFFHTLSLSDILVLDQKNDTLLRADHLYVSLSVFRLLRKEFVVDKVVLDDASVYMFRDRKTEEWNYQFIADAFSSADTSKQEPSPLHLDLKTLRLRHVHFVMMDEPNDTKLDFTIPLLAVDLNQLDLNQPNFDVKRLLFDKSDFVITKLPRQIAEEEPDDIPDTAVVHINTQPLQLFVDALAFRECRFRFDDMIEPVDSSAFDGVHERFNRIDMLFTDCSLVMDTIKARIRNISLEEKSGLVVNHLEADVRVTPSLASASNLKIETPYSLIQDSFSFSYRNFHAFLDFNSEVIISANLEDSRIAMQDLGAFIPGLPEIKELLYAEGRIRGTVDNLKGRSLVISTAKKTRFSGDIDLRGLPDAEETFISLSVEQLTTNTTDLAKILPDVAWPQELARAGDISFAGNFTGFYDDFVAFGTFNTGLGSLQSDLNLKFAGDINQAVYSGNVAAQQFNLGRMIAQDSVLGKISFAMSVKGKGFDFATMTTTANGTVDQVEVNHYNYQNASINGRLDQRIFTGAVQLNDENARLDFSGLIDFNKDLPEYDFKARVDSAQLLPLHLSGKPYILSGSVDMNMQGKNIDDFLGSVAIHDVLFSLNETSWSADSLQVTIVQLEDTTQKRVTVSSQFLDAELEGKIATTKLPAAFTSMVDHYSPSLPGVSAGADASQDFSFRLSLHDSQEAIQFFLPEWGGIDASSFSGTFNSAANRLQLQGTIPALSYKSTNFGDVNLLAFTSGDSLVFSGGSEIITLNDSTKIMEPQLHAIIRHDSVLLHLSGASPDSSSHLSLYSVATGDSVHVQMHILPSVMVLNRRPWQLSADNLVSYSEERLLFDNFTLISGERTITISNVNRRVKATNLAFEFAEIPIGDLHEQLELQGYEYSGNLSGTAQIFNVLHEPRVEADVVIRRFTLNESEVDELKAVVHYEPEEDKIVIQSLLTDDHYDVDVSGSIYPQRETDQLQLGLDIRKADPSLLESLFFAGMISETSGNVHGQLNLAGTFSQPELTGQVILDTLTTTVNYLKVAYHCHGVPVTFNKTNIDLGRFVLFDQNNDSAQARGIIHHRSLDEFDLDVSISTNRFMALNTKASDDSAFYGTAEVSGLIRFLGPVENIDISATVKSLNGTSISIPIYTGTSVGERPYIRYVRPDKDSIEFSFRQSEPPSGMNISLNMDITPEASVQIIFDEATGDIVKGNGRGNIRMDIDMSGEFNMYGVFTIEQGSYVFTQFNFFNKNFIIENGGTITWVGDPYDARIEFSAIYSTRTSLYELVQNTALLTEDDVKDLKQRTQVDLYLILTGSLFAPNISFDIKLPETASLNTAAYLELNRIKRDENELNKQVFALLVLGHFLPPETGLGTQALSTDVNNSLSSFLFSQISNLASSLRDDIDFTINYQAYETSIDPNSTDIVKRNELQVALTKRFFDDRLAVDVGGNFDFSSTSTPNSSSNIAGDFAVEYKITPDGRVSGKVFSKSNYDIIDATNKQNNGISLKYTRDFDNVKELMKDPEREKKRQKKKQEREQNKEAKPAEHSSEPSSGK